MKKIEEITELKDLTKDTKFKNIFLKCYSSKYIVIKMNYYERKTRYFFSSRTSLIFYF